MGRRSRTRERGPRLSSEERNQQVRDSLEPLAPGEVPGVVKVSAGIAAFFGVLNLVLLLAGVEVQDRDPPVGGTVLFAVVMFVAAAFMWRGAYWAVLGFQALLAITVLAAFLGLVRASNAAAVILCVAIVGLGGWLFVKLVRALARLQMPERSR